MRSSRLQPTGCRPGPATCPNPFFRPCPTRFFRPGALGPAPAPAQAQLRPMPRQSGCPEAAKCTSTVFGFISKIVRHHSGTCGASIVCHASSVSAEPAADSEATAQRQVDQPSTEASAQDGELATLRQKIVDLEAKIARVEATTPLDTVLYAAMLIAQLRETAKGKLSISQRFALSFPPLTYDPPPAPPMAGKHPRPTTTPVEWDVAGTIREEVDAWLSCQSQDARYDQPVQNVLRVGREVGVASAFNNQLAAVQQALRQASLEGEWKQQPQSSSSPFLSSSLSPSATTGPDEGLSPPSAPATRSAPATPIEVKETKQEEQDDSSNKVPDFELERSDGSCMTFAEVKVPPILEGAGNASLAAFSMEGKRGRLPGGQAAAAVQAENLRHTLGQAELCCRDRGVRYFAITTYRTTWAGKIEGKKMWISKGFRWDDTDLTVLKVLLWLSLKAQGPDGYLTDDDLPPQGPAGGQVSPFPGTGGGATDGQEEEAGAGGQRGPTTAEQSPNGSKDGSAGGHVGDRANVLHLRGGVLGSGVTGTVLAGRMNDVDVAVKWAPAASKQARWLEHEARVYAAMKLQAKFAPSLLYFGPTADGRVVLVTTRVTGRHLRGRGRDARLMSKAVNALRAVHATGYLHGDVRLPNFLVVDKEQVIVLDFGHAKRAASRREMEQEEQELMALLLPGAPVVLSGAGLGQVHPMLKV